MCSLKSKYVKSVDLEVLLLKFSIFGQYHSVSTILVFIANITNAMYCVNYIFAIEEVPYRCVDTDLENATCSSLNSTHTCSEWIYDNPHSFVAEFQLACQEWKRTLVGTIHSFGYMLGLLIVGPMSDRLGRKVMIVITGVSGGVLGLARSFSTWYWMYVALEFLEALIGDVCSPMFMLAVEMVATKKRVTFLSITSVGYSIGSMTLALVAWLFPYWRSYLRVIYAPALLFFFYKFLLDESPRWLLTKGRKDEATAIIHKAAKANKISIDNNTLESLSCEQNVNVGFVELLKSTFESRTILKRFCVCVVWWTTSTFVNYGMLINSVSLQGNKYINFALISVVEIPGLVMIAYSLKYFKRKTILIFSFLVGSILCLMQPFVPTDQPWLSVVLYMAGKLMGSFFFNVTYIYTSELFPTYTRNSMHALCSSIGRIGSIIAPQTPLLMVYWTGLPALVFGGMALFAGFLTFLVPDTASDSLPDTVKQAEAIGCKSSKDFSMNTIPKEEMSIYCITNSSKDC